MKGRHIQYLVIHKAIQQFKDNRCLYSKLWNTAVLKKARVEISSSQEMYNNAYCEMTASVELLQQFFDHYLQICNIFYQQVILYNGIMKVTVQTVLDSNNKHKTCANIKFSNKTVKWLTTINYQKNILNVRKHLVVSKNIELMLRFILNTITSNTSQEHYHQIPTKSKSSKWTPQHSQ